MAARCSSTKSPTCRARRRTRSCACWSIRPSSASAAAPRSRSTSASSPRPAATSKPRSPPANSARISTTASRWCRSACRRSPSGARTFPSWSNISWTQISQIDRPAEAHDRRRMRMAVLQSHDWPGNVRQLRNNVERLMILAGGDPDAVITAAMLPPDVGSMIPSMPNGNGGEHLMGLAAARGARSVRARISAGADQPLRRQHFAHRRIRRHGALGAAPQAQGAGD